MPNNEECAESKEAKIGNVVVKNNTSSKKKSKDMLKNIKKEHKSKPKKLLKRKEETVSKPVTLVVPVKKPRITETPFANTDGSQNDKLPLKLDDVPPELADTVLIPDIDLRHLNTQLGAGKCDQTSPMSNKVLSTGKLKHEKRKEDNLKTDNAKKVASTSHVGKLAHEIQFMKNELKKREVFEKNILEQMSKLIATSEQNKKMLQSITDNWNEFRETPSDKSSKALEEKTGVPSVGFHRKADKTIHIGEGIYIPKATYDAAKLKAKTGSQFVKKMLIPIFSPQELLDSSVGGGKSNRYKKETQKPPLDPTRLLAVKSIYQYYLESLNKTSAEVQVELKKTKDYISSKISDMRKPPVSKKSLKKNEEFDYDQLEEELEDDGIEVSQSSDEEADDLREKEDQEESDIEDAEKPEFAESDGESDRNILDATGNESEHSATEET
ncbi:uncharacterized protein LOC123263717 [Cotesia glomerata]|nr:uncharacterized protein LOC123263717 [Cotesia glomerata]